MITQELKLGSNELKLLFTLEMKDKTAFSIKDAKDILGTSHSSVWNVLYRLKRKRRIEEIERGKYLLIPAKAGYDGLWSEIPFLILPYICRDYYVGFSSALNYWGMTDQVTSIVYIGYMKEKKNLKFGPNILKFIKLSPRRFFGIIEGEISGKRFKVSSREKTILDCILHPLYSGGLDQAIKGIWEAKDELDFRKLLDYSSKLGVDVVNRRLGYFLELLNIQNDIRDKMSLRKLKGYMWLDPLGPKKATSYSKKYGLIINRSNKELTRWMGN